ncbi:RNA polymerase sigma factor [Actinomadura viridis]|uniref:RNA polymerase sigma factor n=1 Tax=Actinomadura viridis TaxID=58110 RepID=UPI003688B6F8
MSSWSSSGWPSPDRADDERLARSLTAGDDAEALIQLLDRYAARLYDYCHALLRDQESAAEAMHDTVLAAFAHVGRLQRPDLFRGWLYALARNECVRRLQDPGRPAERFEAPEVEDAFLDAGERARRQETRRMVHHALSGLNGREREALDLMLRHGLDATEIGGVLGLDDEGASRLAGEARRRLDDALAAVIIARTGRDCPSAAALVEHEEPPLPPVVTRDLIRHINTCATCTERRHRTVSTAGLLQVLPVALMPADLRGRILATATDPAYAGEWEVLALRAEPFDEWGWPLPPERPAATAGVPDEDDERRSGPPKLWPALAAAAAVILLVAGAFLLMPGSGDEKTSAQRPQESTSAPDPSDSPTASEEPTESPTPTPSTTSPTPTPTRTTPTPTPTRTRASRTPTPTRTTSRPPARGTLSVTGCTIPRGERSCGIVVQAVGGPVTWAVTGANGVSASGGGTLGAGRSTTVTATRSDDCDRGGGSVSFAPGGSATVTWTCREGGPG